MMFNKATAPAVEPADDMNVAADVIPISHLELDLVAPVEGWPSFLAARDIEITLDDIGRMSVSRADARQLLTEKREREAEQARRRKLADAEAVAADQIRRAQIWQGVSADLMPVGVAPAAVMLQASRDTRPRRQSVLEHALGNSGELEFHPIRDEGDAS
jgi:hypothetical protein